MEADINNFLMVWTSAVASIFYCRAMAKFLPTGIPRLIAFLPVVCLFLVVPLRITTMHLRGPTSFFLAWLANFKLLLFACGKGPLSTFPPLTLPRFIAVACLPIKIQETTDSKSSQRHSSTVSKSKIEDKPSAEIAKKPPQNYAPKLMLLSAFVFIYSKEQYFPRTFILLLYLIHIYIILEIMLKVVAGMVRTVLHLELEPTFDGPFQATSLQDFWSRRWNLMVTSILHPTVYGPVRSICIPLIGKNSAQLVAMMVTFLVSGIMHELMFYHLGRAKPTGEMTCFFLLHGVCVAVELSVKRAVKSKVKQLPTIVTGPLVVAFVLATALWLFMPTVLRCRVEIEARREILAYLDFVKGIFFQYITSPAVTSGQGPSLPVTSS